MQVVVASQPRFRQLCTRDTSMSRIYSTDMVRSWMSAAIKRGLHSTERRCPDASISCGGYSTTAQMQMPGRMTAAHRCTWLPSTCTSRSFRYYSTTTQTSIRGMKKETPPYTRPYSTLAFLQRERQSTSCGDCWSMGRTQMHVTTIIQLRYTEHRPRDGSRSLTGYSVAVRT